MENRSRLAAVDTYISQARPFAQPILTCLRDAVHRVVPDVEEAMKWSRPFFLYKGVILGNVSGFKEHCAFGLWGAEMAHTLRQGGVASKDGMGTFGKITSMDDLPPLPELEGYIHHAAMLIDQGVRTQSIQRVAKPSRCEAREIPDAFAQALQAHPEVACRFSELSPGCRREYTEWIAGAKRDDTRARRIATAMEWIASGKSRTWKYERPAPVENTTPA